MKRLISLIFMLIVAVVCLADKYITINFSDGTSKIYDYTAIKDIKFSSNEALTYNFTIEVRDSMLVPIPFSSVNMSVIIFNSGNSNYTDQELSDGKKIAIWNGVMKDTNVTQNSPGIGPIMSKVYKTDEKGILTVSLKAPPNYSVNGLYGNSRFLKVLPGISGVWSAGSWNGERHPIEQMLDPDVAGFGTTQIHLIFRIGGIH